MRVFDFYPHDAVMGCFIQRQPMHDERVLDLDTDMESLPPFGRLCLSETAVRTMVEAFGWKLADPDLEDRVAELSERLIESEQRYDELADAVVALAESAELRNALAVVESRRAATQDEIRAWIDELPKAGSR